MKQDNTIKMVRHAKRCQCEMWEQIIVRDWSKERCFQGPWHWYYPLDQCLLFVFLDGVVLYVLKLKATRSMTFGSSKESKNILSRYTNTKWIYVRVDKQIRPDKSIKYRSIPCVCVCVCVCVCIRARWGCCCFRFFCLVQSGKEWGGVLCHHLVLKWILYNQIQRLNWPHPSIWLQLQILPYVMWPNAF